MAKGMALIFDLIATDGASPAFNRVAASADRAAVATNRASSSTSLFSKKMVGAFSAIVAVDIGAHMVKSAAEFQRAMLLIQTQAGRSSTEVKTMSSAVLGMAGSVGTAPMKLADALYHITSTGLPAAESLKVLKIAAEGAKIGNADLTETTNALTSAVVSGIPGVQNMQQAMGALNAIVGAGDMKLSDLNEALGTGILTKAKSFGLSIIDVGAALATFGDLNIRGANAATDLRMAFEAFAKPAGAKALEKIGLSATALRDDMVKGGLNKAVLDLNDHLKAAGITGNRVGGYLLDAFSKKGAGGVTLLLNNIDLLESKYPRLSAGARGLGDAWTATTKTASFAFDRIKASADAIGITIGTGLLPAVTAVAGAIGSALPGAIGVVMAALKPFAEIWAGLSTVMGVVGSIFAKIGSFLSPIVPILKDIGGAVLATWVAFKAGTMVAGLITAIGNVLEAMAAKAIVAKDAVMGLGTSFRTAAVGAAESSAIIAGSAEAGAVAVVAAGDTAKIGWASFAGPIGIAIVGIAALISVFHKSSTASKEAADAAKAYTDALKTGSQTEVAGSVMKQLADAGLPAELAAINAGLHGTAVIAGGQFVTAITKGGDAAATLRTRLQGIITAGTRQIVVTTAAGYQTFNKVITQTSPAAAAATKALKTLNAQHAGMTAAGKQEMATLNAFKVDAAPISNVADALGMSADQVKRYAGMAGLAVTANGNVMSSFNASKTAVANMGKAYDTATQSGDAYLAALSTFSASVGTSADRATMIGATLKAANGDALGFAGAMNGAASANATFMTNVQSAAKTAKESTAGYLASIVNLQTGTINYSKAAAGPLISDLTSIQTAAMAAAQAQFQHARNTMKGKDAADAAYKTYVSQTRGALISAAGQLGLTAGQAQRLADKYFGMPKDVKTTIEQIGADPVLQTLNELGKQLSFLSGHPWVSTITANNQDAIDKAAAVKYALESLHDKSVDVYLTTHTTTVASGAGQFNLQNAPARPASGGQIHGPGTGTSDSIPAMLSNGEFIVNAKQTRKHIMLLHAINQGAQGFAGGGVVSAGSVLSYLLAHGFSRNAAAGILGNIKIESGFNPNAYNAREGAHGFFQDEGGRWTALQAYARAHRLSPNSAQAQLGYALQEMAGMGGFKGQLNRSSASGAAALFDAQFERSSGSARGARMAAANSFAHLKASAGSLGAGGGSVASTLSSTVGTAVGNVGNAPAGPKFDVATLGIGLINAQIRAAWRTLNAEIHKGLSAAAASAFVRQLHGFTALAVRQLAALKNVIKGHDAGTLTNATLTGTRADVVTATEQMALDARRAGASLRAVANIRHGEQGLLAIQAKRLDMTNRIAAAQTKLADMTTTGDAMKSTLAGNFDTTKYGSVTDLLGGLGSATDTNSKFAGQIAKLSKSGLNKNYLSQLAASGPSATLDTLAGASADEIGQVNKAVGSYTSSLTAGSDAAVLQRYGVSTATQTKAIGDLTAQLKTQAAHAGELVAVLAQVATRPWQVTIDGKAIAHAVLDDRQFEHVLAELRNHLHYGGHH